VFVKRRTQKCFCRLAHFLKPQLLLYTRFTHANKRQDNIVVKERIFTHFRQYVWSHCLSKLVFWVVTPCRLVGRYQRFGGTYCLHLQGWRWIFHDQCNDRAIPPCYALVAFLKLTFKKQLFLGFRVISGESWSRSHVVWKCNVIKSFQHSQHNAKVFLIIIIICRCCVL
jgi:hypothetical protein